MCIHNLSIIVCDCDSFTSSSIMKIHPPSTTSSLLSAPLFPSEVTDDATATPALQQRRKSVRSVRFFNKVFVKRTISRHSMTQQEKYNCWLQGYEFLMIKERNYTVIEQIHQERIMQNSDELYCQSALDNISGHLHSNNGNNGNVSSNTNEPSLCLRGLEWGLELESLRKLSYRLDASEEVFIEQEEQCLRDYNDDEAIACAYFSVSSGCQIRAELTALRDREAIEDYIMYDNYET